MDNKIDLNDLLREKRELDSFLATIAKDEASPSIPVKDTVQTKESSSPSVSENKFALTGSDREATGLTIEKPGIIPEDLFKPTAGKEKAHPQSINAFIPGRGDDAVPLKSAGTGRKDAIQDKMSSPISFDGDKKADFMPRVTSAKSVKPLESLKTMTRFDGTMKSDASFMDDTTPPSSPPLEEKKPSVEISADAKKDGETGPYDFEPEAKGAGKGKWIWGLIILLILLLAGGYFVLAPKLSLPDFGSFFKSGISGSVSPVKEVKIINYSQRLVYNNTLKKSIRVIEGVVENVASHPVSKIKVVANFYNTNGDIIASGDSLGGNTLTSAKLESLDEAGLASELSAGKKSEDILPPGGKTPFMIIFTSELKGVHKWAVVPVDFSKH
jgi:hypothetical protein